MRTLSTFNTQAPEEPLTPPFTAEPSHFWAQSCSPVAPSHTRTWPSPPLLTSAHSAGSAAEGGGTP